MGDGPPAVADVELYIIHMINCSKTTVGWGITSPEALAVLHLADGSTAQEECEVGVGPLAVVDVELYIT